MEKRICKECEKEFEVYSYQPTKCCSRSCGLKYRYKTQGHPRHLLKLKGIKIKHPWEHGHSDKTKKQISATKRKQINRHKIVKCDNCGKKVYKQFGYLWDYKNNRKRKNHFCSTKCSKRYFVGKKSPNWKGGHEIRYGIGKKKWFELSKEIKLRDNFTCQICKEKKHNLLVHHIIPFSISKDNNKQNLITLCISCHTKLHGCSQEIIKLQIGKGNKNKKRLERIRKLRKQKNKENAMKFRKEHPKKNSARVLAQKYIPIINGQLCESCKKNLAIDRHHEDYNKPLEVKFLCKKCHSKIHKFKKSSKISSYVTTKN